MVSKENIIQTNSKCICGNGDRGSNLKGFFENKCPVCGAEGKLVSETENNMERSESSSSASVSSDLSVNSNTSNNNQSVDVDDVNSHIKIVCKNCGAEFCGQDGSDLGGGTRGSLTKVSPYDIEDSEGDEEVSSTEENETTYMSGWEGLCDLLKPLDGEAMMVQRGDYVVVKKIEMPQTARLWAYEGINVIDDSVSITDYTPEIYNTFIVKWGESFENELEFTFDVHKQLFGERKTVVEAKKISVVSESNSSEEENNESDNNSNSNLDNVSISNTIFGSSGSNEVENVDTKNINTENLDANTTSALGNDDSSGGDSDSPETQEVPITDREEAIRFGLTQVGKAKREDGHSIELKVIGNSRWQMGEWCHVKLPSFNEDSYMFISKCSLESSPDSEYINSLTLVDYPPSLGKPKKEKSQEEGEEGTDGTDGTNSTTDGSDTGGDTTGDGTTGSDTGTTN